MSNFDERDVNRDASGRFDEKQHSSPESSLPSALPDPWEYYPELPTSLSEEFADAQTFAEVGERWHSLSSGRSSDDLDARWAAINHGRELRKAGAAGTPTSLDDRHPFAAAQNDAELVQLFSVATEELHGDGMNPKSVQNRLRRGYAKQAQERRDELLRAGTARGELQL